MTTSFVTYLRAQAVNNAWANHRLLGAVAQLSQEDFLATRTSFFPSLHATLNHNLTVDWYYVDALERGLAGQPPNANYPAFFHPEHPMGTAAALWAAQREVDQRLVRLCDGLTEADLARDIGVPRRSGVIPEPLPRLLGHLFEHQIHHRGQAHAMLAGTGVAPPQLDEFYCTGDAPLRAAELDALGYPEDRIWDGRPLTG